MSPTLEQLTEEALALPWDARYQLAERLLESLAPTKDAHSHQLWAAEAQRRLEDVRSGKVRTIPGEEALEKVRRAVVGA